MRNCLCHFRFVPSSFINHAKQRDLFLLTDESHGPETLLPATEARRISIQDQQQFHPMFPAIEADFGLNLLRHGNLNESLVISPLSVIFTLAMIQAGAKNRTKSEIDNVIGRGNFLSNSFLVLMMIISPSIRLFRHGSSTALL